jgi:hypothetical protein
VAFTKVLTIYHTWYIMIYQIYHTRIHSLWRRFWWPWWEGGVLLASSRQRPEKVWNTLIYPKLPCSGEQSRPTAQIPASGPTSHYKGGDISKQHLLGTWCKPRLLPSRTALKRSFSWKPLRGSPTGSGDIL